MVGGVEHHAALVSLFQYSLAGVGQRHAGTQLDAEPAGEVGVRDRRGQVGDLELEEHLEHDVAGAGPVHRALESRVAVGELAFGGGERADRGGVAVPDPHPRDRLRDVLSVGADVLHGRRADEPGDAGQRLDARPAAVDRVGDDVVPHLTGGDAHGRAGAVVGGFDVDAARGDPHDRALEAGVGDEQVGAAGEHEQRLARLVGRPHGLHDLVGVGGGDEPARGTPDAHRRQVRQPRVVAHEAGVASAAAACAAAAGTGACAGAVETTASARPSTFAPPLVTASSTVARPA